MTWTPPSVPWIADLVNSAKTIAIVGVSDKPVRPSYMVAKHLLDSGDYEIYLVNPMYQEILGKRVYEKLEDIPVEIDIVDVFRKTSELTPVFESAKRIKAKNIWLQLGISDEELASKAAGEGMGVVMDRCLKVDHANLRNK